MLYNRIKNNIVFFIILCITGCTEENAEELYPSNDAEAIVIYNEQLKSIIDSKCISCHTYHLEGATRYNTYDKTKASIGLMMDRIKRNDNTKMPPADSNQLTEEEIKIFDTFITTLNNGILGKKERVQVKWTAFKYPIFDEREGVSGSFSSINYTLNEAYENPTDILKDAEIMIETNTAIVGQDEEKTANVMTFFTNFTSQITGKVISYTNTEAVIDFTLNNHTEQVTMSILLDEDETVLTLKGKIENLALFQWDTGYKALDEVCGTYHQNKVWPDIEIEGIILLIP